MFASTEADEPIGSSIGSADCPIVDMGGSGLPAGRYGQIRLITVDNNTTNGGNPVIAPETNACAIGGLSNTTYNCVESGGVFYPLVIPGGSQTGIKIPPGQAHRGGLRITANQAVDLDIDVDACRALVVRGGGNQHGHGHHHGGGGTTTYALKPTLHTGEVSLNPIISGSVVLGTVSNSTVTPGTTPVPNAQVWLETDSTQSVVEGTPSAPSSPTNAPVNSVVAMTTTDSNGNFFFCPVPVLSSGSSYDIVADADAGTPTGLTNPSDATITTGVTPTADGLSGITIPLVEPTTTATTLSAQVSTQVSTTVPSTTAGVGDDIVFFGTQSFSTANPANQAQIPPYSGTAAEPQTTTSSGGCTLPTVCPINTNCVCFNVVLPPDNPVVGPLNGTYTTGTTPGDYALLGSASEIGTTTPACSPSQLVSVPAASYALPTLSFTGCN
jgi:hypothetical protein